MKKYIQPSSMMMEADLQTVIAASLPIVEETVDGSNAQTKFDDFVFEED